MYTVQNKKLDQQTCIDMIFQAKACLLKSNLVIQATSKQIIQNLRNNNMFLINLASIVGVSVK